jgi:hypothetical protein
MTGLIAGPTAWVLAAPGVLPFLAAPGQPGDPGGQGEDFGKSSPVGLVVLILFFIAVGFLVRSMTKHLRKVPASFDEPGEKSDRGAAPAEPERDGGNSAESASAETSAEPEGAAPEEHPARRPHRG